MKNINPYNIADKKHHNIKNNKLKYQLSKVLSCIKTRCYNKNHKQYSQYGGAGITVCDDWINDRGVDNFYEWAIKNGFNGEKDAKGYNIQSIDRIDNNKGYYPENCRWATRKEQANNKTTTIWVEYKGEKDTLKNFCDKRGLDYHAVYLRIYRRGWTVEKALSTPIYKDHDVIYNGRHYTIQSLCKKLGICPSTLKYQIETKNKTMYEAINHCLHLKGVEL